MFKQILKWLNPPRKKSLWEQEMEKRDPHKPINFGPKWIWGAVKTEDTDALLKILNLKKQRQANWVEGILVSEYKAVFVLPPIDGWTLISGWGMMINEKDNSNTNTKRFLNNLSSKFKEAHLYCSQRTSSTAFWMKSVNGEMQRLYILSDGLNQIEGERTLVEKQWDLYDARLEEKLSIKEMDQLIYPSIEEVLEIANAWSINPMTLENREGVGGFGYVGVLD